MCMTFNVLVEVKFILEPLPRKQIGENIHAAPEYNLVNTTDFATESPKGNHLWSIQRIRTGCSFYGGDLKINWDWMSWKESQYNSM